jgi:hypothetical protein
MWNGGIAPPPPPTGMYGGGGPAGGKSIVPSSVPFTAMACIELTLSFFVD